MTTKNLTRQQTGKRDAPASVRTAELTARGEALRQAAAMPEAELRPLLDAALTELDAAVSALADLEARSPSNGQSQDALRSERHLFHAVFQQVPTALFLLGADGTIRRANGAAAELLGASPGYPTGKLFTALVDPASRAAVQSQLAAVVRTGEPRRLSCGMAGAGGVIACEVAAHTVSVRGDDDQLMLAVLPRSGKRADRQATPRRNTGAAVGEGEQDESAVMATMTRRLDMVMAVNRLLLENVASSEAVLLQRTARLLADHFATWVLVDIRQADLLRRHCVAGPDEEDSTGRAQQAMAVDPAVDSAPAEVAASGSSLLLTHVEDDGLLGRTHDGTPLFMLLRGSSVLSVPISAGGVGYGALTLVRSSAQGPFQLAEAGLAEEAAEQLARTLSMHHVIKRRTEAAEALQGSLLPRALKPIPGVRVAAAHLAPTRGSEVGGDFYDIYPTPDGWGVAIGDVCGKRTDGAAVTAAARHAIRVLAHRDADPVGVLRSANEIMLAEAFDGRFVTADAAHLRWRDGRLRVVLASAGHPGPVLITSDGRAQLIEGGGVPLGVFPDGEVAVVGRELTLSPGDVLFFCTDGLTGARSPDLTYFGDRLPDVLGELAGGSPAEMISGLQARLTEFCDGILLDDVTMFALQATGQPPPGRD